MYFLAIHWSHFVPLGFPLHPFTICLVVAPGTFLDVACWHLHNSLPVRAHAEDVSDPGLHQRNNHHGKHDQAFTNTSCQAI